MITYEQARKKAFEEKDDITRCVEFSDAWLFKSDEDEYTIGGFGPIIVLKETGQAVNPTYYYDDLHGGTEVIRSFAV